MLVCNIESSAQTLDFSQKRSSIKLSNRQVLGSKFGSLQYKAIGSDEVIVLKTYGQDRLHIYRKEKGAYRYYRHLQFEINGPNGTKTPVTSAHLVTLDTILVMCNNNFMGLFDQYGKKFSDFKLDFHGSLVVNGSPFIRGSQCHDLDGVVFCSTSGASYEFEVERTGIAIDYRDKNFSWLVGDREEILGKGYWGTQNSEMFTLLTLNPNKDEIVISLPHYKNLIVYSPSGQLLNEHEASLSKNAKLPPLSIKKKRLSEQKQYAHDAKYGFYLDVDYNPYEDVYYRVAFAQEKNYKSWEDAYNNQYLIVLDGNYNILDEVKVPQKYNKYYRLITPEGLCLFNEDQYSITEDYFQFDCFKVND